MGADEGPPPLRLSGFASPQLLCVTLGRRAELCRRATAWKQKKRIWWCSQTIVWILGVPVLNN